MKVKFNDLNKQWQAIQDKTMPRIQNLFETSQYINGPDVSTFEYNFANFINTNYCVGTSNGTDAIKLAIKSITNYQKDLILIPANTFIATALGAQYGNPLAYIAFVDCDKYCQINVELLDKIIKNTRHNYNKCIIVGVHLFGHCCDVESILQICEKYNCIFIEDSAQAHGTMSRLGYCGSIGKIGAFSFYPGKNLGACGDAGGITTNDEQIYHKLLSLRNLGTGKTKYEYIHEGYNNRLDTIQAIILDEKLKLLHSWNENRIKIANIYHNNLSTKIRTPNTASYCLKNTYHLYVIQYHQRDELAQHLQQHNIETGIHYPIPIEQTGIFVPYINNNNTILKSKQILSLPIHPFMTEEECLYVCKTINEYVDRL